MRALKVGLTKILILANLSTFAIAEDHSVVVTVDRAKVFQIEDGASAVIVGNPFIADVAMFDQNTVVITGKSYGTTNLVILDSNKNPIVDEI
ncbi:MAG: pilus assembly protein N-terminal domain-containing protein, partial [Parasphingorhabdus sp.]